MKELIKKIAFLLSLFLWIHIAAAAGTFSVSSGLVQPTILQNQLTKQIEQQIQEKTDRPWQLAIISVSHPTAGELEKSVLEAMGKNSALKQVVLVRVSSVPYATEFKRDLNTKRIIKINLSSRIPRSFSLSSIRQVLRRLDHSNSKFYTGLVIDAHGTGNAMSTMMESDNKISIRKLFEEIKQEGIKIDVLELKSCSMGSISTLYHATKSGMVDYLLASPPVLFQSSTDVGLLFAASQVPGALSRPETAARAALTVGGKVFVENIEKNLGKTIPPFATATVGYYLPELYPLLRNWGESLLGIEIAAVVERESLLLKNELWPIDPSPRSSEEGIMVSELSQRRKSAMSFDSFLKNILNYSMDTSTWAEENKEAYEKAFVLFSNDSATLQRHLNTAIKFGLCYKNRDFYPAAKAEDIDSWPEECLGKFSLNFEQMLDLTIEVQSHFSLENYKERLKSTDP